MGALLFPRAGQPWTPAEDDLLRRRCADAATLNELMGEFGRSRVALMGRAQVLGLRFRYRKWRHREVATLVALHTNGASVSAIAATLGRSLEAVVCKAGAIGLSPLIGKTTRYGPQMTMWSEDEDELLRIMWAEHASYEHMAKCLNRTGAAIQYRARHLGILRRRCKAGDREPELQAEVERLGERGYTQTEIARRIGRSVETVLTLADEHAPFVWSYSADELAQIGGYLNDGCSVPCIAERLGRSERGLRYAIETHGLDECPGEFDSVIADLSAGGMSERDIASKLELNVRAVRTARSRQREA